jgi:hypothetical protein
VDMCFNNYEAIVARFNLLILYSRQRHFDASFLINVFKIKISCYSIFDTVNMRISTRIIINDSTFMANHNVKVSPTDRYVSGTSASCKITDTFNKDHISLTNVLPHCFQFDFPSLSIFCWFCLTVFYFVLFSMDNVYLSFVEFVCYITFLFSWLAG